MEKHHALRYGANSYPPGQECHGSNPRCVVWPTSDGASLPALRRPETGPALSEALMRNRFFLLLGLFPGSLVPAVAQTPTPWNVLAQEHVAPNSTMISTVSTPLPAASFLLAKGEKSNARFSLMFAGAYKRDHSLEHLSPMNEVKNLSLTRVI